MSDRLTAYLRAYFGTKTQRLAAQGVSIELSFGDFLGIIKPDQLRTLEKAIAANSLRYLQAAKNPHALVITWKSYRASQGGVLDLGAIDFCSRMESAEQCRPKRGDALGDKHRGALSKALTGKAKTEEHKAAISEGSRGMPKAAWTPERREARVLLNAAKRAAREASASSQNERAPTLQARMK